MTKKLYKVLVDGKSCHGGTFEWSLPHGKQAGKWHHYEGDIRICNTGLHLTTERFNWYKWGCTAYEAEAKDIIAWEEDKCVARSVRLIKKVPHPKWWNDTVSWIDTLKDIAWLTPDGNPKPEWQLFETRDAARDAAGDAARAAAGDAAWAAAGAAAGAAARDAARDAAWAAAGAAAGAAARDAARDAAWAAAGAAAGAAARDAALYSRALIVADLKLEEKHRTHIKARMEVWQRGYGLLCDVGGILYVYKKL